jgi:V/A-type H+/Na+-transporting ATPase subunit I
MIRPRPARWFEILAARDDATLALEALAATAAVELEARAAVLPATLADIGPQLAEYAELDSRYGAYWPTPSAASPFPEAPSVAIARSLARIRAWAVEAESVIADLQRFDAERAELELWRRVLATMGSSAIDFARLAGAGPTLHARLVVFPHDGIPEVPSATLARFVEIERGQLGVLAVGTDEGVRSLAQQAALAKGRSFQPPAWLRADAARTEGHIARRLALIAHDEDRLRRNLTALANRHGLARALADAARLQWLIRNVRALEAGDLFCWITGWTSDLGGARLQDALERCGARALLRFPPAASAHAPLLLDNPRWARPFEIFSRALGMPSRFEADPSALLAITVPFMFGYMFGDVGQGLLIAFAGFALRKRFRVAPLFIAGGFAAAMFGALFGSAFGLHHAVPALWIDPLEHPLAILAVPLAGGALLLTIGLALNALESWWRGDFARWATTDCGFVLAYIGILVAFVDAAGFAVAAAGAVVFCTGHALHARRVTALFAALAELVERLLQILINTLSFARVGAFALAHAGLSSAIVALMAAAGPVAVKALVLIAGNALVLALEAMVVSIQTTRLVLFEFFTRFLTAEGRMFHPLAAPPSILQEQR